MKWERTPAATVLHLEALEVRPALLGDHLARHDGRRRVKRNDPVELEESMEAGSATRAPGPFVVHPGGEEKPLDAHPLMSAGKAALLEREKAARDNLAQCFSGSSWICCTGASPLGAFASLSRCTCCGNVAMIPSSVTLRAAGCLLAVPIGVKLRSLNPLVRPKLQCALVSCSDDAASANAKNSAELVAS